MKHPLDRFHSGVTPELLEPRRPNKKREGLTPRERAALQLRVPDGGNPKLDAMIRTSLRQELVKAAMQGLCASSEGGQLSKSSISEFAISQANVLLAKLEEGR